MAGTSLHRLPRKIMATVLAAALAVTSVNVGTAQAGDRDAVRIIVGATALAIIGSALVAEQRKKDAVSQSRHRPYDPPRHTDRGYNNRGEPRYYTPGHDNRYQNRHDKPRARRISIPRNCLMSVRGSNGWTEGYAVRCTQNQTRATLPSDCVRRNFAQGPRLFYAPVCLRRNGFDA
ncbi:hypothetical protein KUW14_14635 [Pseudooceanicola nitratireducens]|uniref:hypothetical protein n=1 Tax=Pseudooceanicola nitratireducens TaxID=517719 RepID=UPI001C98B0DD|nr:hypothetical protein [Pseudooceanicola nitratireducens]MBY6167089.1 hypothetical protein [Pseudooceanicola nitratireducens]